MFNTVLGEELLFRGFLLPRMQGAFGKRDWVANGVLFAFYHLHVPWIIPLALFDTLFLAYPARRYRSAVLPIIVHSVQSVVIRRASSHSSSAEPRRSVGSPHMTPTTSSSLVATLRRMPPLWWDIAAAVCALALGLAQLPGQQAAAGGFRSNDAAGGGAGGAADLPLAFRRRAPMLVLGVLLVALLVHTWLGYEDGIGTVTPLLALFTVAAEHGPRQSLAALGLVGIGVSGSASCRGATRMP